MKPFFALYTLLLKELKANKTLFLFLLLLIAGLNAYGLIRIEDGLELFDRGDSNRYHYVGRR